MIIILNQLFIEANSILYGLLLNKHNPQLKLIINRSNHTIQIKKEQTLNKN